MRRFEEPHRCHHTVCQLGTQSILQAMHNQRSGCEGDNNKLAQLKNALCCVITGPCQGHDSKRKTQASVGVDSYLGVEPYDGIVLAVI